MGVYSRVLRNGLQVYNRENMPVYQNGRGRLLYQAMTSYMMPPAWVYNALPLGNSLLSASSASCTSSACSASGKRWLLTNSIMRPFARSVSQVIGPGQRGFEHVASRVQYAHRPSFEPTCPATDQLLLTAPAPTHTFCLKGISLTRTISAALAFSSSSTVGTCNPARLRACVRKTSPTPTTLSAQAFSTPPTTANIVRGGPSI